MRIDNSTGRWLALILASGVIGIAAFPAVANEWDYYKSAAGRFSVKVPETPVLTTETDSSFIGTITSHLYTVLREDHYEKFTVDYSEIPSFAVEFTGADTIMDHAKGALLSQTMSKPTSYVDFKVDGFPGKRLTYETPPRKGHPALHGEAVFVMVGHRLYVIDAQLPMADKEERANRFLSSVDLSN